MVTADGGLTTTSYGDPNGDTQEAELENEAEQENDAEINQRAGGQYVKAMQYSVIIQH